MNISWTEFQEIKKTLSLKKELKIRPISDSMSPLLKVNEILTIKPIDSQELKTFDIIVFWYQNTLMCHFFWARQTSSNATMLITKSLKEPKSIDLPSPVDCLLGIVNCKTPWWAKIYLLIKSL